MRTSRKKIKLVVIILTLPFVFSVLDSCVLFGFGEPYQTKIVSMSIIPQRILGLDTTGYENQVIKYRVEDIINPSDTFCIGYDSLGILLSIESMGAYNIIRDLGFQPIYAWDYGTEYENITDVTITSDNDYDQNHPAGTDLSDLVSFHIAHLIREYSVSQFEQVNLYSGTSEFFIRFISAPQKELTHNLFFSLLTEDNNCFELEVNRIQIKQ